MRPTGLELLHGVRTLLLTEVLPEVTAPHLRSQVMLAVGMLDSAAAELDDAPASAHEERTRMIALAAEALPVVRRIAPGSPLVEELGVLAVASIEPPDRRVSAFDELSASYLGVLDRLGAFADEHEPAGDEEIATLSRRVVDELGVVIARRASWIGGGR